MKIKLDENIPTAVGILLHGRGIDVDTVLEEYLGGHSDPEILAAAKQEDRLLITMDSGFGHVRACPPGSPPGIIVLRPADTSPPRTRHTDPALQPATASATQPSTLTSQQSPIHNRSCSASKMAESLPDHLNIYSYGRPNNELTGPREWGAVLGSAGPPSPPSPAS